MMKFLPYIILFYVQVQAQIESSTYDDDDYVTSGSSGFSCSNILCQNNGICVNDTECKCPEGFTGSSCEIDTVSPRYFRDQKLQTVFSLILKKVTFKEAVDECVEQNGRIVSNISHSNVIETIWNRIINSDSSFFYIVRDARFWAIPEEYPSQLSDLAEGNCSVMNFTGYLHVYPCTYSEFSTLCETPMSGVCYPEVKRVRCTPPQDVCTYEENEQTYYQEYNEQPYYGEYNEQPYEVNDLTREVNAICQCRIGFHYNRTSRICTDVNECDNYRFATNCYYPAICQNVYGSYRCGCDDGKQGNGNGTCGYVLTLEHRNIDLTKIAVPSALIASKPSRRSTASGRKASIFDYRWVEGQLQAKLKSVFWVATKSVVQIVIKTINMTTATNTSTVYDAYVNDSQISTTSLLEFYREADRQNKLSWLKGTIIADAFLSCTQTKLRLGPDFFTFSEAKPGSTVGSSEKCPNGRSRATAACKRKKNSDGLYTAYFDYNTVISVPCEVSLSDMVGQFSTRKSPETAELAMAGLDLLMADYTNTNPTIVKQVIACIKEIAEYVWNYNVEISVATMTYMMNVANNINKGQKYDRETSWNSQLDNIDRRDIVTSLERCSTHVYVAPSQHVTIQSELVTLQMTNALPKSNATNIGFPEGILFRAQTSTSNQNFCPTDDSKSVQALINQDVLSTAKGNKEKEAGELSTLPVSFMYFADSEFFSANSIDYEIEQVLSLRISNLELDSLHRPIWFQIPRKQRQEKKHQQEIVFYKCAYLEETTGKWLSNGCKMITGSDPPKCTCDHMTNFAVLVQLHPQLDNFALEVFGKIFCSISIIGLLLTLLIHLYFPSLRRSQVVKIHCHLALSLLLAYLVLLTSTERPRPHNACVASAAFLQFFLLSSWGWMVVECVTMYKKLVAVFSPSSSYYVTKAAVTVYVVAAAIVITTVVLSVAWYDSTHFHGWSTTESDLIPSIYISDRLCWLQSYPLILGFLVPIGIAFVVNIVGSILILRAITCGRQKVTSSAKDKATFRSYFIRTVTISVLLGLCWVFAIPLTLTDDPTVNAVFAWLFSITNALQGFFIFIFFCVMRDDVRKLWWKEIRKFFRGPSQQTGSRLFTSETGRDTRVMSATVTVGNTDTTKMEELDGKDKVLEEDAGSREHFEMGTISTFHPKSKESDEEL